MAEHGHDHGGGHKTHAEKGHGDHGHDSKDKRKMGWFRKLTSIIRLTSLSFFAADLAKPLTLDPVHKSAITLLDFAPGGGDGGGGGHGAHGGHGAAH